MRTRLPQGIVGRNSWGDVFKAVNIDEPLMHSKGSVDFAVLVSGRHILTLNILLFYKNIYTVYIWFVWTNQRAGSGRPLRLKCCKGHQRITNAGAYFAPPRNKEKMLWVHFIVYDGRFIFHGHIWPQKPPQHGLYMLANAFLVFLARVAAVVHTVTVSAWE